MNCPKRPWLRFSLRTLFVLVMVLCVWLAYQVNWIRERHKAKVGFGHIRIGGAIKPSHAPLPLNWFGEEGHSFIMIPDFHSKEEIDRIKALFPEAEAVDIVAVPADFVWPEGSSERDKP